MLLQFFASLLFITSPWLLYRLYQQGYFLIPVKKEHLLGVKDLFIALAFVLISALSALFTIGFLQKKTQFQGLVLNQNEAETVALFFTCLPLFLLFCLYFIFAKKEKKEASLGHLFHTPKLTQLKKGAALGLATTTLLFLTLYGASLFLFLLGVTKEASWNPYTFLKSTIPNPYIFSLELINLTLLLPCVEEILFRGFIQRYTIGKWGPLAGIIACAIFFTFTSHALPENGDSFPFYFTLFLLSLFASYAFERHGSLLASIAFRIQVALGILFIGFCFP